MLAPVRTAPPVAAPVGLVEMKSHLRVIERDGDGVALPFEDDDLIKAYIAAAVDHLDGWAGILGRALVTQTWRQDYAGFGCLRLALGPVASVASVTYFDAANETQTLPPETYVKLTDARGAYLSLAPNATWPGTFGRPDAVSVTYVAGQPAADVPAPIKTAIMLLVGNWYANREASTETAMTVLPMGVQALLAPYRRVGV